MTDLNNQAVDNTGMGRIVVNDPRDALYAISKTPPKAITKKTWSSPGVYDQGDTSMCVAYSGMKFLTSGPVINKMPMTFAELYNQAQLVDEYPGENYDGTSVRACYKVFKKLGLVSEYNWAGDVDTIVAHLLTVGPVQMGTSWYMDMGQPDRWGYIDATGEDTGGHAWLIIGVDTKRKNPDGSIGAVRMINSWGASWGDKGRAWIKLSDLKKLIQGDGEACLATEIKKK